MPPIKETLIYCESALQIVTDPFIVGDELLQLSKESSKNFLRSLDINTLCGPFTVLNILRGGRYYRLVDAWNELPELNQNGRRPLRLAEIRAARKVMPNGEWFAKVWHDTSVSSISEAESEQNLLSAKTLIIGDTIATAATLMDVLRWLVALRQQHGIKSELRVIAWSICGSSIAKHKLLPFSEEELRPNGIEIELVLANAGYVLNEANGTDLSLISAEMVPRAKAYVQDKVGAEFMKHMKCAIWDWGDRFNSVHHHLDEVGEYFARFHPYDLPPHLRDSVRKYMSKARRQRAKL